MGLPDLRAGGGVDDAVFTTMLDAAITVVGGDTSVVDTLDASGALAAKSSKTALKVLIAAVREVMRSGMSAGQIKDDASTQGAIKACTIMY